MKPYVTFSRGREVFVMKRGTLLTWEREANFGREEKNLFSGGKGGERFEL